ncbi:hypothetical protein UFOVP319_45 [uncultured Caudovirales phage]|uniref:Uncharacterized protein n=1 Tax=uncultured Caudovirales phage TaxID=2100421 RepID=A0A6J5LSM4_9CAUD|nr:hypothetical protein UFOVP319_45 [uncultured Caudovirales phage]
MEDAMMTYQPDHAQLKRFFEDARDTNDEYRKEALIDRDYWDGYQWTEDERRVLEGRKQPPLYFNEVKLSIRGLVGVWEQGKNDPRAWPRNPQDEDSADVATKVLRYVKDYAEWDAKRTQCALQYFVEGTTAALVQVDEHGRVDVEQIRFEEFFHDPRSRALDFSDARYMGIAKWMFADDVAGMFPDHSERIMSSVDYSAGGLGVAGDSFSDRPEGALFGAWADPKLKRVFIVEMYHKERFGWARCVFWGGGVLESGPSPYADSHGKPDNPIKARSCYIDRENRRYGEVRDLRSPQDAINKRESKLLHMLNNRQAVATDPEMAYTQDAQLVRSEMAKPDGVIPPGWSPASLTDLASGQFSLLASAREFMQRLGQNPAVLAQQSASASGRAQIARQQAGMVDSAMTLNGLRLFELSVFRAIWQRCKQFWSAPDFIRITDDMGAAEFIGINQPVQGEPQPMYMPDGSVGLGQPILGYQNALAEMDVDISIDSVPDTANLAQEQFDKLVELAQIYGPQEVPFDDLLEVSALPEKNKLIMKRKDRAEQAGQAGQAQQEIAQRGAVAEITKTEAEAALAGARAQNEAMKPMLEGMKAGFVA